MNTKKLYYGIVGNGETVCLVSPGLAFEWFCAPRFDSFPIFSKALDHKRGGSLSLHFDPSLNFSNQEYWENTNVLRTIHTDGKNLFATIDDFMPWGKKYLIRIITLENTGEYEINLKLKVQIKPVETKSYVLNYRLKKEYHIITGSDGAVCFTWTKYSSDKHELFSGVLRPGEKKNLRLIVTYGKTEKEAAKYLKEAFNEPLTETINFWKHWLNKSLKLGSPDIEMQKAYYRSLLVLKLLTYPETGAIIAAPTASFPATPGGSDNWDYRYCWLRDGFYTATAFDAAGFHEEARSFYDFAFSLQHSDGSWPQPLYTVDGKLPKENIIPDLEGPNGEKPIRFGNKAAEQLQLDNAGSVIHGLWHHYRATQDKDYLHRYWDNIQKAAHWVEQNWQKSESGIWEIREYSREWIYGKVLCYISLTNAAQIARELGYNELASQWEKVAETIKEEVTEKGWSPTRHAYVQHYGSTAPLDISVLALEFFGLVSPTDSRLTQTVACFENPAICELVNRATTHQEENQTGLKIQEAVARFEQAVLPFFLPTLWLAHHYLLINQRERALEIIKVCLKNMTSLYLMAEHFDPRNGEQWGNFPLALNHQELIRVLLRFNGQI